MSQESITIPESVPLLASVITQLGEHPALSPLSVGTLIELPCCGSRVDVEAIDCSQDGPSRVYWPPRWTCLGCRKTFGQGPAGYELVEVFE